MSPLRYTDSADKPLTVLDMTSLTIDEFAFLTPLLETAFQAHMAAWRLNGKPRTVRTYTTYKDCPLPLPADRLLFVLVYLKTNPLQVVHGVMFGLPQGKTNQWLHVLLPLLRHALRAGGYALARSVQALAARFNLPHVRLSGHLLAFLSRRHRATDLPPKSCC